MSKGGSIAIVVITIVLLIIFAIIMFEMYRTDKGIFAPYVPPPLASNAFYPLGGVVQLSADQQAARKAAWTKQ